MPWLPEASRASHCPCRLAAARSCPRISAPRHRSASATYLECLAANQPPIYGQSYMPKNNKHVVLGGYNPIFQHCKPYCINPPNWYVYSESINPVQSSASFRPKNLAQDQSTRKRLGTSSSPKLWSPNVSKLQMDWGKIFSMDAPTTWVLGWRIPRIPPFTQRIPAVQGRSQGPAQADSTEHQRCSGWGYPHEFAHIQVQTNPGGRDLNSDVFNTPNIKLRLVHVYKWMLCVCIYICIPQLFPYRFTLTYWNKHTVCVSYCRFDRILSHI
jgi:hypothetical protein